MALFKRSPDVPALPYPPSSPEGLATRWVQWAASCDVNPIEDRTGAAGAQNQPADVWFLAGTYGGRVSRRLTVPAGRPLFFPAFNMWFWPTTEAPDEIDRAFGRLTVDGRDVPTDLVATPRPFLVSGVRGNAVTGKAKPIPVTVTGFWKLLDPLPPGTHALSFTGGDGYGFELTVDYELTVA